MKTGYQTALKVISVITIILAIIAIIAGLLSFATVGLLGTAMSDPEIASQLYQAVQIEGYGTITGQEASSIILGFGFLFGTICLIEGIITLIVGILGVRGSNDPRKIGPFKVFAIIGLVISIISIISVIFTNPANGLSWVEGLIALAESGVGLWLAVKIQEQARTGVFDGNFYQPRY